MPLFQYQLNAIAALKNAFLKFITAFFLQARNVIFLLPTGGGKTFVFSAIVDSTIKKSKRALIVTDRAELLTQASGALSAFNLTPTLLVAGKHPKLDKQLYVCMVETLYKRLCNRIKYRNATRSTKQAAKRYKHRPTQPKRTSNKYTNWLNQFDLIVLDEAHKTCFDKLFDFIPQQTFVIGATATPERTNKQRPLKDFYSQIVEGATIAELQKIGRLSTARYFGYKVDLSKVGTVAGEYNPDELHKAYIEQKVYDGLVENYRIHTPGQKMIAFFASVESSLAGLRALSAAGYPVQHIDSTLPDAERKAILSWYKNTPNAILCNVGILTTGFDAPDTRVIGICRAIKESLLLYLQIVGRGGRVDEATGKTTFTVLDFGGNVQRFDFWHAERVWSLEPAPKKRAGVAPIKECECGALVPVQAVFCDYCGLEFPKPKKKEVETVILTEIEDPRKIANPIREAQIGSAMSLEERGAFLAMSKGQRIMYAKTLSVEKMAVIHEMNLKPDAIPASMMLHWIEEEEDAKKLCKLVGYKPYYLKHHKKWKDVVKF